MRSTDTVYLEGPCSYCGAAEGERCHARSRRTGELSLWGLGRSHPGRARVEHVMELRPSIGVGNSNTAAAATQTALDDTRKRT